MFSAQSISLTCYFHRKQNTVRELSQLLEVSTTISFCTTQCDPLCKVICCVDAAPSIQLSTCQCISLLQNCIIGISDQVENALPYVAGVYRIF